MRNSPRNLHRYGPRREPWRPPAGEKAVYFASETADYISFADPPRINDASTDFCLEVVIRPRATPGIYSTPVSKHTLTQGVYFSTDNPVSKVLFAIDDTDVGLSFPVASAGEARYYAVSYYSSTLYGYSAPYDGTIGGVLSTVGTAFPSAPTTTSAAFEIGGLSAQAVYGVGYAGEVMWVRWWNKGKSPAEINRWWNRRLIPGEKPPKDLAFWWDAAQPRRDLVSGAGGTFNGTVSQNPTYAYPKYFWTERDHRRSLPLISTEAGASTTTLTPTAASTPLVAPAPTVTRTKTLTPTPASTPLVAPSSTLVRTKTVAPNPATTPLSAPSPTLVMGTATKTPTPAATPLVAPSVTIVKGTKTLTPNPASTPLSAPSVTLSFVTTKTPTPASTSLVAPAVTVVKGTKTVSPNPASTPLVAAAPTIVRTKTLTPTAAATALVAPAPTIVRTKTATPNPAATPLVAPSVTVVVQGAKTPDPAVVTLVAPSPTLVRTKTLTPSPASTPLVAASSTLVRTKTVSPTPASTPLVAASVTLLKSTAIRPSPATTPLVAPGATITGTGTPPVTYRVPDYYWFPAIRHQVLRRRPRSPRP